MKRIYNDIGNEDRFELKCLNLVGNDSFPLNYNVISEKSLPLDYKYRKLYLTIECLDDEWSTLSFTIPSAIDNVNKIKTFSYSLDNGKTWITRNASGTGETISITEAPLKKVLFKGNASSYGNSSGGSKFAGSSDKHFKIYGNIMSLLYEDDFIDKLSLNDKTYVFALMFKDNYELIDALNLILPALTLTASCYSEMFRGCGNLTVAPLLPATSGASKSYYCMFNGCTVLEVAPDLNTVSVGSNCCEYMFNRCRAITITPKLPATTLASSCYLNMFNMCTSLTTILELPATTLTNSCYNRMFSGCTALIIVPELPATTLANNCYSYMFNNCTALTTAPKLPATTLADSCYSYMFGSCTSLTTAPVLPATTLADYCYSNMFDGCTSLTTVPTELPATTLANSCYSSMFSNCTSLTTAPELPAETLITNCYTSMFYNCSSLNYIKAMFTTTPTDLYTMIWVTDVAATGTFVKNGDATWNVTGNNGVPSGWTVETATE